MPLDIHAIVAELDTEIQRLQKIRATLTGADFTPPRKAGRPKGSKNGAPDQTSGKKTRTVSPEGRERMAEAQRKRWAAQKKSA